MKTSYRSTVAALDVRSPPKLLCSIQLHTDRISLTNFDRILSHLMNSGSHLVTMLDQVAVWKGRIVLFSAVNLQFNGGGRSSTAMSVGLAPQQWEARINLKYSDVV